MRRVLSIFVGLTAALLAVRGVAAACALGADARYDGELEAQEAMARGVDRWIEEDLSRDDFATGSSRFDGEWLFATRMMAVLGYAQTGMRHPELREAHAARANDALYRLITQRGRAFDAEAWGSDPLDDLGTERAHVAYLGYLALALSLSRELGDSRHELLEERVIAHLVERFEGSELGLLESYPGEIYPIDNTSFMGALAVHDRVTGEDHSTLLERLMGRLETDYRDPHSGLLYQAVDPDDGAPLDRPRGSGTALAAYFLSFADMARSRSLYRAIRGRLYSSWLGFGTVREYPPGVVAFGDVDSGPVILGRGVSATGFTIALARLHGDREAYAHLSATASLFGGPVEQGGVHHALGGPIGDALLFALMTAEPRS